MFRRRSTKSTKRSPENHQEIPRLYAREALRKSYRQRTVNADINRPGSTPMSEVCNLTRSITGVNEECAATSLTPVIEHHPLLGGASE